eukprot:810354_1
MQQPPGYNPGKEGEAPPPYMPPTVPIASQQPATAPVMCQQPDMATVACEQPTVAIAQQPYAAPVMGQQPTVGMGQQPYVTPGMAQQPYVAPVIGQQPYLPQVLGQQPQQVVYVNQPNPAPVPAAVCGRVPARCVRTFCNKDQTTVVLKKTSWLQWLVFFVILFMPWILGCFFIPLCMYDMRNFEHRCSECRRILHVKRM